MPRRKPVSGKQKKAEKQLKKAIKRGDVPAPEKEKNNRRRRPQHGRIQNSIPGPSQLSSKRLASAFTKISPEFLAKAKERASNEPLPRPLPPSAALFPMTDSDQTKLPQLTCPKRPKWRFDMSKKELEKNEEGVFAKWLAETDNLVDGWRNRVEYNQETPSEASEQKERTLTHAKLPERSATYFERNLEVWRQLWRVTEASQILLVLLDCRCPPVHYPPSLHNYLSGLRPARKIILVLTKVDIVGIERALAWEDWLAKQYGKLAVVKVSSYTEIIRDDGQVQGRVRDPHLKEDFRAAFTQALKSVHEELCRPPESIKDNPEKLARWKPRVRVDVNWDLQPQYYQMPLPDGKPIGDEAQEQAPNEERPIPEHITLGLIGQPNVGKSSLLNALFGSHKVKASRTPGKTKHFQTMFLNRDIRLVDCPGLVFPSLTLMEQQVLSAVLPIAQIPSIPSCIQFALQHIPLEKIFKLEHPSITLAALESTSTDKKPWPNDKRKPYRVEEPSNKNPVWTAMDVLTAYAIKNGWVTAMAGRPDENRAGNALLRILTEGKIQWGFLPPEEESSFLAVESDEKGIWLEGMDEDEDYESDEYYSDDYELEEESEEEEEEDDDEEEDDEEEDDEEEEEAVEIVSGRFGALALAEEEA